MNANLPCPHCAAELSLSYEYLAQYGGAETTCPSCQRAMTLPLAKDIFPFGPTGAQPAAATPQPDFGELSRAAIPIAQPMNPAMMAGPPASYGQPAYGPPGYPPSGYPPVGYPPAGHAPGFPPQQLAYASPALYGNMGAGSVLRDGNSIVAAAHSQFPYRCVKCGGPGAGNMFVKRTWIYPWTYLIIFAGLLIFVIVLVLTMKNCQVSMALCERHRKRRQIDLIIGYSMLGAFPLTIGAAIAMELGWIAIVGVVFLIASLIMVLGATPILRPRRYDNGYIWLGGAGEPFLSLLPTVQQAQAAQYYAQQGQHAGAAQALHSVR